MLGDFVDLMSGFGAGHYATGQAAGLVAAWRRTPLGTSLALTAIYIGLWRSIEGVIVPMLSYLPVLAPFWFISDETTFSGRPRDPSSG